MNEGAAIDVLLLTSPRPPWVSPRAFEVSENSCPPLGVLYLASVLEQAGIRVHVEDLYRTGGRPRAVAEFVERLQPRIVGISTLTSGFELSCAALRHARRADPSCTTVLGGPHATAVPGEALQHPEIDVVVRGEGEQTLLELCRAVLDNEALPSNLGAISGLAYRDGDAAALSPERPLLSIDEIPEPARHLVPIRDYLQPGAIIASRGCPHRCFFCSSVSFGSHQYRFRSPGSIVVEMDGLHQELGLAEFEFLDDVLTANPALLGELCVRLRERAYRWGCQATIKDIAANPSLLREMSAAGCGGVFFGVEAGNEAVLKKVKGLSTADVMDVVELALSLGMRVITSFMIGHPWDTRDTIADTSALMARLRGRGCRTPVSILVPFPGSDLATYPERFGVRLDSQDYSAYFHNRALLSTRNLSRAELDDIYFEILYDITSDEPSAQADADQTTVKI